MTNVSLLILPEWDVRKIYPVIERRNLVKGLNYAHKLNNTPPKFKLNKFNSTDAAIKMGEKCGIDVPDGYGTLKKHGTTIFSGSNPGVLGQELINKEGGNYNPEN